MKYPKPISTKSGERELIRAQIADASPKPEPKRTAKLPNDTPAEVTVPEATVLEAPVLEATNIEATVPDTTAADPATSQPDRAATDRAATNVEKPDKRPRFRRKSFLQKTWDVIEQHPSRKIYMWGGAAAAFVMTVGVIFYATSGNSHDGELDGYGAKLTEFEDEFDFLETDAPKWNPEPVDPSSVHAENPFDELADPQLIENPGREHPQHDFLSQGTRQAVHFSENNYEPVQTVEHQFARPMAESRPAAWLSGVIEEDFESSFEQGDHARFRPGSR